MKTPKKQLNLYAALLVFAIVPSLYINAQNPSFRTLWQGMRQPQPEAELPRGNVLFIITGRVEKREIPTVLTPAGTQEWIISEGWELADGKTVIEAGGSVFDSQQHSDGWYNATVPGTVLTTLVNQGVYPDPYFGLNNMHIPESLNKTDWWYRCKFDLPQQTHGKQLRLLFNGINYRADIYLNGKKVGETKGAFIRGMFDITALVNPDGENILAVHVFPPYNPGIPHEQSIVAGQGLNGGVLSIDGPTFISSAGWDWIPAIRDRNTGIWQDVRIKAGGDLLLGDPLVTTHLSLPDTTQAKITIRTTVRNSTPKTVNGVLTAQIEQIRIAQPCTLGPHEEKEMVFDHASFEQLTIDKPRLWWPNGYGNPQLYPLELTLQTDGQVSDAKTLRFGIRELSYELMINDDDRNKRVLYTPNNAAEKGKPTFDYINRVPFTKDNNLPVLAKEADTWGLQLLPDDDPVGPFLVIRVNGVRIFCRGGNWGMDDGMKRVSRERLEPYIRLHKDANFNIIRNWTGETTEEAFYALCDEYGMLVWNDFWITTDDTVEPSDFSLFVKNATDVVRRFRNHPSIAVWCPRNEGFLPHQLEKSISAMVAAEDPTRHYHGQSRYLNMGTSGPWGYFNDPAKYYTENAKGFNTEMGSYAIPTAHTIRKFIAPEDQWPINDVWAYHDLHHTSQNFEGFIRAVERYGKPESMEDFVRKSQFVCYDAWRNMLEAWNSKMWNNTTGLVLWMSHPAWPSMIWQTYTYDYETPGSYFGAKKACEPVHIQMNLPDNEVMVVNTTLRAYQSLRASVRYIDLQGREFYRKSSVLEVKPNSTTACFVPEATGKHLDLYLARLELKTTGGHVLSINDYWIADGDSRAYEAINTLAPAEVSIKTIRRKGKVWVEVSNTSNTLAAAVKLNAVDAVSGEILLPVYFTDGYINLLPKEKRIVGLDLPDNTTNFVVVAEGYNATGRENKPAIPISRY